MEKIRNLIAAIRACLEVEELSAHERWELRTLIAKYEKKLTEV